jgi:intracellular septation protein A
MENMLFGINAITIATLLLAIIFTAGIVWRVEKKLDISYKFFLTAIIFLLAAEVLDLYYGLDNQAYIALAVKALRMFFALFFLAGVLFMRKIVRDLDGEN